MKIKIKLLNIERYKNDETFDAAIERWVDKGWQLADVAQDLKNHPYDSVAILWRPIEERQE